MYKILLALSIAATAAFSGTWSDMAQAGGNTARHVSVTNTLGTGRATTVNRESRSTGADVYSDIQVGVSDGCGQSRVNNNVSHPGAIGASVSVNVDVCNPAAGRTRATRRN